MPGFPAFDPVLQALKSGCSVERSSTYKVCCQRAGSLLVLESLAQKWVANPLTADRALETIKAHNAEFNESGDYWVADRNMFVLEGGSGGKLSGIESSKPLSKFNPIRESVTLFYNLKIIIIEHTLLLKSYPLIYTSWVYLIH